MKEKEYEDAFITKELTIHSDDRGFIKNSVKYISLAANQVL